VHRSGWSKIRIATAAVGALGLACLSPTVAGAAPAGPAAPAKAAPESPTIYTGDQAHPSRDADYRTGAITPNASQKSVAAKVGGRVTFNNLGTPAALSGPVGKPLATGLTGGTPDAVARQYLAASQSLFGLDAKAVDALETVQVSPLGTGAVVLLRQRFGDLPAGRDGLVAVTVKDGSVIRVTSSLSRATDAPAPATLTRDDALTIALRDAGLKPEDLTQSDIREVAVPTPADGPRSAYEVTVMSSTTDIPTALTSYIDGQTGAVLVREDLVDFDADNPKWAVYPATPPPAVGVDQRQIWCAAAAANCAKAVVDAASGQPWDTNLTTGTPSFTTVGNSANDVLSLGNGTPLTNATTSPARNYTYPFTDQWHVTRCNPDTFNSPQRVDADAAIANLFAMHNSMHDFSYRLGFTEAAWNLQVVNLQPGGVGNDAEQGRAQQGALSGNRNNANQGTPRDGLQPTTNMFLWQPQAGSAYPPCVDGDYDMTVIGHEYTHAITNRMIAGPDSGISGQQGGSMGESWGDLDAGEYLFENGYRAPGNTPWVTGAYVTGNNARGIRNYDISLNPLNYSDFGYDIVGNEVHADGEIWNATNYRVRQALVSRYGQGTPALNLSCAQGLTNIQSCPGNRRWIQLMYDSFLLQAPSSVSMLDMRDNMLAADLVRFNGANQDLIWQAFAQSGMGMDAVTNGSNDVDPTPSFASPLANNATVHLAPLGDSAGAVIRLYAGDFEARSVPIADTDPETAIPDTFQVLPNAMMSYTAVGNGFGAHRFTVSFLAGRTQDLRLNLPKNLASASNGATASGDGVNLAAINDDTEATDWASLDGVAGKQVSIDLAGTAPQTVSELNVSAMLRPAIAGNADPLAQNRFTALRSFQVLACDATKANCATDAGYTTVFTSAPDAFPAQAFRPTVADLNLRTFNLPPTVATNLRIRVLTSQCTGNPLYAGEQDNDPRANTDCATASPTAAQVRIAEVQVFTR
jgi:extracellular elastinolytic metalloproteinase